VTELYEVLERPDLDAPVLVLALDGWIDAGLGAQSAREALVEELDTVTVATFDAEALIDHRARRPVLHIVEGVATGLTWPSIELRAASDDDGNDLLLLVGAEPDQRWRAFAGAVVDLALDLGARLAVGLGAYPAPVPHTRPSRLAVTAGTAELARHGQVRTTVDVPAGVQAAIEHRCTELGVPALGLWAQVPHYAAAMPYPAAGLALVDGLASVGSLSIPTPTLTRQAGEMRQRLDELVGINPDHAAMLAQMEAGYDADEAGAGLGAGTGFGGTPLPSGDELAAEVERYLREQD